jgi:CBS domain containing-hemolysin-like protein
MSDNGNTPSDSPAAQAASSGLAPQSAGSTDPKPSLVMRLSSMLRGRARANLRENLEDALDGPDLSNSQAFSPEESAMLRNILRLREVRVEDVMIERADIEAVDKDTPLSALLVHFERAAHSRRPVFADTLDDPRGMVHIRDVLAHLTRSAKPKAAGRTRKAKSRDDRAAILDLNAVDLSISVENAGLIRPVLFVPMSMPASDLMARMQAARIQMALVIDEYGGTDGLVSLEDIVEMVVGDIEDEHDDAEAMITAVGEGMFIADARAELDEVARVVGEGFDAGEQGEDVDSIGGLIVAALGRVPARGEMIQAVPGFEFDIVDADPRRIRRIRIRSAKSAKSAERRRRANMAVATGEGGASGEP